MRFNFLICILLVSCNGGSGLLGNGKSGQSGQGPSNEYQRNQNPHQPDLNANSKPGDGNEGLPGYLVDPQHLQIAKNGTSDSYDFEGRPGSVSQYKGNTWNAHLKVFEVFVDGKVGGEIHNTTVNPDGSFKTNFSLTETQDVLVQVVNGSNGPFDVTLFGGDKSNTINLTPSEGIGSSSYYTNTSPTFQNPVQTKNLVALYQNDEDRRFSNDLEFLVAIRNDEGEDVDLNGYEFRYYFTSEGLGVNMTLDNDTNVPTNKVSLAYIGNQYLVFRFYSSHILTPGSTAILDLEVKPDDGDYDQENDPSYDVNLTNLTEHAKVHIYYGGIKVWGD